MTGYQILLINVENSMFDDFVVGFLSNKNIFTANIILLT